MLVINAQNHNAGHLNAEHPNADDLVARKELGYVVIVQVTLVSSALIHNTCYHLPYSFETVAVKLASLVTLLLFTMFFIAVVNKVEYVDVDSHVEFLSCC